MNLNSFFCISDHLDHRSAAMGTEHLSNWVIFHTEVVVGMVDLCMAVIAYHSLIAVMDKATTRDSSTEDMVDFTYRAFPFVLF